MGNIGEIVLYQPNDEVRLEVRLEDETVWLSQAQMVLLFQTTKQNVSLHVNNLFKEGELDMEATVKDYLTVQKEGEREIFRNLKHYNLDVIISVGYRVKSKRGTQFRQWANRVLKEYMLRGYAINQRFEQVEKFAIEAGQKFIETNVKLDLLMRDINDIIKDQNDINEDTRMQLELMNKALAELQTKHKGFLSDESRIRVGYTAPQYKENKEG